MCTQLELVEINAQSLFKALHKHLHKKGATNLNDKTSSKTGVSQEYLLADKRLQYSELLKLDGPVEVEFVSVEDEDLFFAMPLDQVPSLVTWRPDGLGWMNVPPRPTNKNDMVLLSNEWWVELRRSFDSTVQSVVQYQLFESGFLRLLIIPVPMEDVMRALILTNLPVVLSHLHSYTPIRESGANLLAQCMIFLPPGEFPATLDDITHGDDERHSINPPDEYFHMPGKNILSHCFDAVNGVLGIMPHQSIFLPHQQAACAETPVLPSDLDVGAKCLAKQPLPVLLRQTNSPKGKRTSHLFPHQKRTVGWMVDIESGISPPLFCPLANMFGGYHVFSYGMVRALPHNTVEVLQPRDGCLVHGGMIAHPVGSGKTVIAIELVRRTCSLGDTVICVPDHIVLQWRQELHRFAPDVRAQVFTRGCQIALYTNCLIVGHGDIAIVLPCLQPYYRLIIDEPQEVIKCDKNFNCLLNFSCAHRWLLTATPQPLGLMMQLALQYEHSQKLPFRAMEAWFVQTRCRRDPPTLCLPVPSMHIYMKPITLLWQETSVMHSYALQDDLQTAIRLASFFHTKKAILGSKSVPGLEKAKKFSSLAKWVRERGNEIETQLLEHKANVERIEKIMSKAAKEGVASLSTAATVVGKEGEDEVEEIDPEAMERLYEQHPGVPEELLLERERSMKLVNKAKQLLTFMDSVMETVTADSECLICMNKLGGRVVSMLPCLHSCCASCIITMFCCSKSAKLECPLCRRKVLRHMICTFLCAEKQLTTENSNMNLLSTDIQSKFGSKIFAIVSEVLAILRKTLDDKIVVFAQWADLLEQISAAIPTEVEHCLLCGSMETRCRMIEDFRLKPSLRVMLLSSESQASGANLEVANHVIIAHPYCPPHIQSVSSVPLAQAQAFEQQAIGRILRFPQQKDVFLYRFYSLGTPEEELYIHWGWAGSDSSFKQGTIVG